ncbi:MAG: hypothetical protein ACREFP_19075 [Acetobacteraceae bacterium]
MSGIRSCSIGFAGVAALGVGAYWVPLLIGPHPAGAVVSFATSVLGNWGFERAQALTRACAQRPGRPTEENQVIVRALRKLQLESLREVRDTWNAARRNDRDAAHRQEADSFDAWLGDYLKAEASHATALTVQQLPDLTAREFALIRKVEAEWPGRALQAGLAGRHGSPAAVADWSEKATLLMVAELRESYGDSLPPLFVSALIGGDPAASPWFDLFVRRAAALIRSDPAFRHTWETEQQAVIRDLAERISADLRQVVEAVPALTATLTDVGTRLDAIAGDVAAIKAVARQIQDSLTDVSPWLEFVDRDTGGLLRFASWNPAIPFVGRINEMASLAAFLHTEDPLSWWIMTGPGGAGKTRIARELCWRAHAEGWRVGFLQETPPETWRPHSKLLIIADYAGARMDDVRTLARRLTSMCADPVRVRLLLIERHADEAFWQRFYGAGQDVRGQLEKPLHSKEPLSVPELSDSDGWTLVQQRAWMEPPSPLRLDRATFFRRLAHIDRDRRALVAMMLAEAEGGAPGSDLATLLRELIRKTKEKYWLKDTPAQADLLISAATMVGRLQGKLLEAIDAQIGRVSGRDLDLCAHAIGVETILDRRALNGIQPDLIGEFFVLETLVPDPRDPSPFTWLPEYAWRLAPAEMAGFCQRAVQNMPGHAAMALIAEPPRDDPDAAYWFGEFAWAVSAIETQFVPWPLRQRLACAVNKLAGPFAGHAPLREALASVLYNTLNDAKAEERLERRDALLEELRALARAWPDDAAVRERLAKGLGFASLWCAELGDAAAQDLLVSELEALAQRWLQDETVRAILDVVRRNLRGE